jgi:hypothetical protein
MERGRGRRREQSDRLGAFREKALVDALVDKIVAFSVQ